MYARPITQIFLLLLLSVAACKKREKAPPDKLPENRSFVSKEVTFDNPLKVFTNQGEITNQGIINSFYYRYPSHFPANEYPYIDTLKTAESGTLFFGLGTFIKESFDATVTNMVLTLEKRDTIKNFSATYQDKELNDLLNQSFERYTYFEVNNVENDTISRALPKIKGLYKDNNITLPFTRVLYSTESSGPQPRLFTEYSLLNSSPNPMMTKPKDTIVMLQGRVVYFPY
jgi:hypothetical protein